ncbi:MAG TPA: gluconate 2-dehydrogenase subunit 3 family protein, partial [Polyangiaceae bacterium]|nr:gluconate 2-dehydrogenase subunit 3 family protein [Polyangiaceae bacterium]
MPHLLERLARRLVPFARDRDEPAAEAAVYIQRRLAAATNAERDAVARALTALDAAAHERHA